MINDPTLPLATAQGWYLLTDSWNSRRHYYISVIHGKMPYMEVTVSDDITVT